ncbi:MAG: lactate racemase domain-containing protein [bacterium]|nr:lactate racemase domain-containing protein [candidate division KSB1 bacterium]MDH7558638.1 lactate racemase domain-containing protein [bacterium]
MLIGRGDPEGFLSEKEVREIALDALSQLQLANKRVLVIIPDLTRNAPIPLFFRLLLEAVRPTVKSLDFMIALGTHQPLSADRIAERVGVSTSEVQTCYKDICFINHAYDKADQLSLIGTISKEEIGEISGGLLKEAARVTVASALFDYDLLLILSPVVPHEVAGFSGGNKYLFPGVSGAEFISFFHWLSAIITNLVLNGIRDNPIRRLLDRAASFLPVPRLYFNMVYHQGALKGLYVGDNEEAWSRAADLSARVHIRYVDGPYTRVLGIAPPNYEDLWVAGKVMYKLEPVVADGGELIVCAPHISEISYTHGATLRRIGYHVRDYYLAQMERFSDVPRGVLAHSTHVKGAGSYEGGVERPRINVSLATAIPEDTCRQINLGYRDWRTIDLDEWRNREQDGVLLVEKAGEVLYRLRTTQP